MSSDPDRQMRQLQLLTRYAVEHQLAGKYRSVFKGRGMDFDDIRAYEPGDEVRAIDWNVTARTGKPHIKRYIEERELAVWLLVDTSASCRNGQDATPKWETLYELAALLTLSAIHNQDRVGLILFSDRIEHIIPPRRGRRHANRVLSDLLEKEPTGRQTNLQVPLDTVGHLTQRRSLIFLMSDFLCPISRDDLSAISFRHDLIAVAVNDLQEQCPPPVGLARVMDVETGEQRICDFTSRHQRSFRDAFAQQRADLNELLESIGVDLIETTPEEDGVEKLTLFFRNRQRRAADETGG